MWLLLHRIGRSSCFVAGRLGCRWFLAVVQLGVFGGWLVGGSLRARELVFLCSSSLASEVLQLCFCFGSKQVELHLIGQGCCVKLDIPRLWLCPLEWWLIKPLVCPVYSSMQKASLLAVVGWCSFGDGVASSGGGSVVCGGGR